MNQRVLRTALFAWCGSAAFALPAFAQTAPAAAPTQPAATAPSTAPAARGKRDAARPLLPVDSRMCVRDTGSHIPPPKGQCLPVPGNSYSQQDLLRTGHTNLGRALQMLDPSVTLGH